MRADWSSTWPVQPKQMRNLRSRIEINFGSNRVLVEQSAIAFDRRSPGLEPRSMFRSPGSPAALRVWVAHAQD
jgi:hypothetical protein